MEHYINVDETFFPGHQINDPRWFSGRKEEIKLSLQSLSRKGSSIIVYGDRGTGKTSLIEMIKMIAQGDDYLVFEHKLHLSRPHKQLKFKVAEVTCDADTTNIEKVLQRLITSPKGLRNILASRLEKIEKNIKTNASINLGNIFGFGISGEDKVVEGTVTEKSVIETFCNIVHAIQMEVLDKDEQLLIVIDELDLVLDKSKLSSLIKNLSQDKVTFLLSGIANDYTELVEGHQSITRQLYQGRIKVLPMTEEEINGIFDLATKNNHDLVVFNKPFRDEVIEISEGYPYFVQLCGQLALDRFAELNGYKSKGTINTQHLIEGLEKLVEFEPVLDDLYHSAIGEFPEREIMLKGIASQKSHRVRVSDVYKYCEKRNVKYPKKVLTYLLSYRDKSNSEFPESIIRRLGEDFICYEKTLFKLFVKVKQPIHKDIN
jgi:hypothetical protein